MDGGRELRGYVRKLGLPFLASLLLLTAAFKLWEAPTGDMFAACLLGAALVLLGISVDDWIHHDDRDNSE